MPSCECISVAQFVGREEGLTIRVSGTSALRGANADEFYLKKFSSREGFSARPPR